ncbi:DUF998 domain-containing protein [Algoriphagus namhaensis]
MFKNKIYSYIGALGAFLFVLTTIIGGYLFEGYSHVAQYISESYAFGTEYGRLLRWMGYVPSGLFMAGFCFWTASYFKRNLYLFYGLVGFGVFYGLFTSIVSVFPCDYGCNRDYSDASFSQWIHSILSVLTYAFTPVSLFVFGIGLDKNGEFKLFARTSKALGVLGLIFGMVFLSNSNSSIAGLLQRNAEAVHLFWIVFISIFFLKNNFKLRSNINSDC